MISKMSANNPKSRKSKKKLSRQMAVVALLSAGILQPVLPVLALGTAGGTDIKNTATATFDNPNGGTTTVTSNEVTIKVAEVAGVAVANAGFTDVNGSSVTTDDILYYDFKITNTGNDSTAFYLPAPNISGGSIVPDGTTVGSTTINGYTIINQNGTVADIKVTATGEATNTVAGLDNGGYVKADEYIIVRVAVKVTATALNAPITVTLGDGNDVAENVNSEVRTIDALSTLTTTPAGEGNLAGAPVNLEQEGTATNTVNIGVVPNYKSFATILKTNPTPVVTNNVTTAADDVIQYGLQLKVNSSAPVGSTGYTAVDLQPVESVKFSASKTGSSPSDKNVVIMSDAIPANTRLAVSTDPGYSAPVVPTDSSGGLWKVWYAYNTATNNVAGNSPLEDIWTDQAPANATEAATVKRIAFVKEGAVAKGTTTTVGTFNVVTSGMTASGTVYNIAQVVGQSETGAGKTLVYDESGDPDPSNFEGSAAGATSDLTLTTFNAATTVTGIVTDTTSPNNDPGGNNGTGVGGENTVVSIGAPVAAGLLTGPANAPGAAGPTDNQDDFTNKTTDGISGAQFNSVALTADPAAITFSNSVASSSTLNNVVLRPIDPTTAAGVDAVSANNASYGSCATLPNGTTVEIGATVNGVARTALYTLAGGGTASCAFSLTSSKTGTSTDPTPTPIIFSTFTGGVSVGYTVKVDLPQAGTNSLQGYAIPIAAYVEGDGVGQTGYGDLNLSGNQDQSPNVTINRLYTGFIKVNKAVRILDTDGSTELMAFTDNPSVQPKPGQILEYRITYENIATAPPAGSGSVSLSAGNFKVVEDGRASVNTWGLTTTHVLTKVVASNGTTSYYDSDITVASPAPGVAEATSNTGYVNTVGTIAPASSGNFKFQRKLN
jgi:hypothetical protein